MVKKTKSISINIISVFIILICLLLSCVGVTNAWFTSESQNGVLIKINVGKLQLNLYQDINGTSTKILTDVENGSAAKPQYVVLNGAILPDVKNDLILTLSNEDEGSASMYVRFKFEIYARGVLSDTLIESRIDGYVKQTSTTSGFVLSDGYYYYRDKTGANALFEKGASEVIMESFIVPYSSFINDAGTLKIINSDTIYINLVVEASSSPLFSV